jgi:hypothetical protein
VHTEHVRWRTCTKCGVLHLESESESERKNLCCQKWELVGVCVCGCETRCILHQKAAKILFCQVRVLEILDTLVKRTHRFEQYTRVHPLRFVQCVMSRGLT